MAYIPPLVPPPLDVTTNLPFAWQVKTFPYGLQYKPPNESAPAPYGNNLQHGYMLSADDGQPSPDRPQAKFQLHFLYNPSQLTVAHSSQAANTPLPAYLRPDNGTPMVGTGGNLSFSLLYDRTYEVNQPDHPAYDMGVQYDVQVLYGLVGITTPMTPQASSTVGTSGIGALGTGAGSEESVLNGVTARTDVSGIMQMYPVWATFGLKRNFGEQGRYASAMSVMKYFGYVNSLQVTYTHWTQGMVPDRCGISIGMTLMANNGYSVPFS